LQYVNPDSFKMEAEPTVEKPAAEKPEEKKVQVSVPLSPTELEWLFAAEKKFGLPSTGKALRCCVNFAAQTKAKLPSLVPDEDDGRPRVLEVASSQMAWLEALARKEQVFPGAVARACVRAAKDADEKDVFETRRCKNDTYSS